MITQEIINIINKGNTNTTFQTGSGLIIAQNCIRVVIGGRGPYIEFSTEQILSENIHIPKEELYRLKSNSVYYDEYRTNDVCNVKLYFQKHLVKYADYKVGLWYISPSELFCDIQIKNSFSFYFSTPRQNERS
jgi:hypothetical protein